MRNEIVFTLIAAALLPVSATAESLVSIYGGHQSAPHSVVTGEYNNTGFGFTAGWDGKPFAMPPYYGIRYTNWNESNWGLALDFAHSKVYANDATLADSGFEVLEFTDGINVLTLNALRRFPNSTDWTPYLGTGAGIAVPHVEVQVDSAAVKTFEYQFGGPAIQLLGGVEYKISDRWATFAEYKFNYIMLNVDLDGPGNNNFLKTDIITNAINIGVSYRF